MLCKVLITQVNNTNASLEDDVIDFSPRAGNLKFGNGSIVGGHPLLGDVPFHGTSTLGVAVKKCELCPTDSFVLIDIDGKAFEAGGFTK